MCIKVRFLGAIGGKDASETTRRIMRSLMTNAVAERVNFAGRGGKKAIQEMKLLQAIIGIKYICVNCRCLTVSLMPYFT